MNKIKKHLIGFDVLMLMVLLITSLQQPAFAQKDKCSKPKVAVIINVEEVNEGEFIKHLNEQYPPQPKGSWLRQIQEKVLEELRMNSPETQFISAIGEIPNDCDYYFKCLFALIGAGEDIEVAGALQSEYIAYFMSSTLAGNTSCGIQSYILNIEITEDDQDINKTIERNIGAHGDIGERIKKFEESHRVPPRGPEMKVTQDREYVSPLEGERELKIKIDVTDCKGETVYDRHHGQLVILPKKTERGELECPHAFPEECLTTENLLDLIIVRPVGALATYTLKKGLNAEEDPIKILTCGIDRRDKKEMKIQIHGLELKVKPEKKEVFPRDEQKITVQLSEVDKKGAKQPVAGKHIKIQVKGLVDGGVDPSGDVITDQNGKAILFYDAGEKDKKVIFKARFQPKDYPESVKDETAITVAHYEGQVRMTYIEDFGPDYHKDATVRYNLGKELQSLPVGEHLLGIWYPLKSGVLLKASARSEIKTGQSFHLPNWSEWSRNSYIIMVVDTKTEKFIRAFPLRLAVLFTWSDGTPGDITEGDEEGLVTGGDGIHELTGSCSGFGWTITWRIHMRERH